MNGENKEGNMSKINGVIRFSIDCDLFVGTREEFLTAEAFLQQAIDYEDCGFELAREKLWDAAETFTQLIPYVKDNGFIVHRCSPHPSDADIEDWWEFVDYKGRGHIPVWSIDMNKAESEL